MMNIPVILQSVYPGAQWALDGDDYDGLLWLDDAPKPSRQDLEAAWPAVRDGLAWDAVRVERDRLLAASDWTQMPDTPLNAAEKQAWAVYRQTLRDVPQDFPAPDAVVWPVAP